MSEGSNGRPKHRGVPVEIAGEEWIIPALSIRHFREFHKKLFDPHAVTVENLPDTISERLPIVLLAIQRNYPEVTHDELLDLLDLPTFLAVVQAIAEASGLRPAPPGERAPVASTSIGDGSMER